MAFRVNTSGAVRIGSNRLGVVSRQAARRVAGRATENDEQQQQPGIQPGGTFFFKGKSYTAAEWEEARNSGQLAANESIVDEYKRNNAAPEFTELMKFDGVVPERANGRLAMIAVIAAVAAEFSTGKSVLSQIKIEPTLISLTFLLISAATFIPFSKNVDPEEKEGIFTPSAEVINGRAAMLGFASLLVIEAVKGGALFGQ